MGSDERHFNASVGSDGQSHKTVSTKHNLFEKKGEPKRYRGPSAYQPNALPQGQTGSQSLVGEHLITIYINNSGSYYYTLRAQELCESLDGRSGLPVPNNPYGLSGRKTTLK